MGLSMLAPRPRVCLNNGMAMVEKAKDLACASLQVTLTDPTLSDIVNAYCALSSGGGPSAPNEYIDLYHGTSTANAASIRGNGIDLSQSRVELDFGPGFYTSRDAAQALDLASRRFGSDATVLHYRIRATALDALNGRLFAGPTEDYLRFVRSMRSGDPMHSYDVVEGPTLRNPLRFLRGQQDAVVFGNQVSFHTQEAVDILNAGLMR